MAACTITQFDAGCNWSARAAERNAELLAQQPLKRRRVRTPEFHFVRRFDNSRIVKAADPVQARQMRVFSAAAAVLLSLIMVYGLQHFYAIESSYRVESEKQVLEKLQEQNRQLLLNAAELSRPARIDKMARQLGFSQPAASQVIYAGANSAAGAPTLAQLSQPAKTASSF